ncbi:MAG: hypothetical protein FWF56_06480 [Firmicutes bacterium]|nr:hypothetical protein [Bacillota bacterium]MCL1953198.1 hypothetical protein [Bacillota bacterium]
MHYKSKITGDLYDICNRIKQIDESYFLVRNHNLNRFELHSSNQKGNTLCLVIPYSKLDTRTLEFARKTRVERHEKLLKDMDLYNQRLLKQENDFLKAKANDRLQKSFAKN